MSEFKVGDKVRIARKQTDIEAGGAWLDRMDDTIGKIGIVTRFSEEFGTYEVKLESGNRWNYLPESLELVKEAKEIKIEYPPNSGKVDFEVVEVEDKRPAEVSLSKIGNLVQLNVKGTLTEKQVASVLNIVYS